MEDKAKYCVDCGMKLSDVEYALYHIICKQCIEKDRHE